VSTAESAGKGLGGRVPELDGLRGLAILLVIVFRQVGRAVRSDMLTSVKKSVTASKIDALRGRLRDEYDVWHQHIYEAAPGHDDASSPWYQLVREYLGAVKGLRVLEVACGRGGFLRELALAGACVTGCDFSFAALGVARTRLGAAGVPCSATLTQGDAQRLPFADDSFDLVVSCETIEHLPEARTAMKEMHRVTRPGGRLLLTTPNYANFMGVYAIYSRLWHHPAIKDQPFDRRQWFPQIRQCVRGAGWRILRTDGTVHQFPFFRGRSPMRLEALESCKAVRKLLSPLALHYFVMAQKEDARGHSA
jgi:ubiquinone/menaquinone biosynthesis C-methylase UbiE